MSRTASTDIVMAAFAAVERRDERRLAELYHPEIEFHWPPSLPYGGALPPAPPPQPGGRPPFDQRRHPSRAPTQEPPPDPRVTAAPRANGRGAARADRRPHRRLRPYLADADRSCSRAARTPFVRRWADALGRVRPPRCYARVPGGQTG